MQYYQTKAEIISGTDMREVQKKADLLYESIVKRTKRRPYLRSKYFKRQKIFLGIFWKHLHDKVNHRDKLRRLKCIHCALELIEYSQIEPDKVQNPNKSSEFLYRFKGRAKNGELFIVQIKENTKTNEKFFISAYPA